MIVIIFFRFFDEVARNEPPGIILRIADEIGLSPALLSRFILEVYSEQHEENKSFEEHSRASLFRADEFNDEKYRDSESDSDESSTTPDISDSENYITSDKEFIDLASKKSFGILQNSVSLLNIEEKKDTPSLANSIKNKDIPDKKK